MELLREIEELRIELHKLAKGKELSDPVIVNLSQELDRLLNKYHSLYNKAV